MFQEFHKVFGEIYGGSESSQGDSRGLQNDFERFMRKFQGVSENLRKVAEESYGILGLLGMLQVF